MNPAFLTSNPAFLTFLTFAAVVTACAGVYSIVSDVYLRDRSRVSQRVDEEFRKRARARAQKSLLFKDHRALSADGAGNEAERASLGQRFETMIEQSGLDLTPSRLLTIVVGTSLGLGLLGGLVRHNILVAAVGAIVGGAAPIFFVKFKRNARSEKLLSQLSDAFDLMSRVIRAGQTMSQGLQAVADEFSPPIATEFAFCFEQQNMGLAPETALRELARRTGLLELKIFVLAMLIQQQTGGNLAELLDKLSHIIRERYKLRGKIQSLTAEGRMQAMVLLGLPPGLFLLMLVINRSYAGLLLEHTSLIWMTVISETIGGLWIRKIVNFDF
ncbi:MAG: type II secretion system F family protein [Isosphaeraceae bacterium]